MKRRDFIKYGSAVTGLPLILNGQSLFALGSQLFPAALTAQRPDRKLVLVQLNGGNDGLNTFVPLDQFENLQKARPNIIIPQSNLLPFTETIGLHPHFAKAKTMFDEEKFLLIQNVGYPQPNLSHFRSKDIVTSGSASDVVLRSGWAGRMLNGNHPDYPTGYPNETYPHPIALTVGSSSSQTCQGYNSNLSAVIKNLDTTFNSPNNQETYPETPFGDEVKYIAGVMQRTEVYLEAISEAAGKADNLSAHYPESDNKLSDQLKIVARLIAGGLHTQVYVVSMGGWDTHADQTEEGIPENGRHRALLTELSDAIYAFQDDLNLLGIKDDVIGFVYSEFGRRIKSNESLGTDHGTAWPAMLFGSMVNPTVLGSNPVIPESVDKDDNLPMQYDFRSVYASIFKLWFEADDLAIEQILYDQFEILPILKEATTSLPDPLSNPDSFKLYPNPVRDNATFEFRVNEGPASLYLYASSGAQLGSLFSRTLETGNHQMSLDFSHLPAGTYYLGYRNGICSKTLPFVKL